jgi:uncharacterized protein (DUF433 family)
MQGIEINPRVCSGKPVVAGTRIPVTVILDQLADGDSIHDLLRKYPELTAEQVAAALHYCHGMIDRTEMEFAVA